mgnify:CR=1 FL=1|tara:strand:+ start:1812 stop:2264 length:453 start_codon:yes stop_codon:yes gene_type:complete
MYTEGQTNVYNLKTVKEADKQLIKKYQQGDVLLYKMPKRLFEKCLTSNHIKIHPRNANKREIILAFGEATGHSHAINSKPTQAQYWVTKRYNYSTGSWIEGKEATALKLSSKATIRHQEHKPLIIPQGYYIVEPVLEFNHITKIARRVAD